MALNLAPYRYIFNSISRRLLELTKRIECKINLIAFNPHQGTQFEPSSKEQMQEFRSVLIQVNIMQAFQCIGICIG